MVIYWICSYLLPQLILVNFKQFSKVIHSFGIFYALNFFQALGVLIMSIGLKGTMKTIIRFPPIILTPMFSIWTIGPVMSKSVCGSICCNGHQRLGVSFCLTWINLLLTFTSGFAYVTWLVWHNEGNLGGFLLTYLVMSCPFLAIAMIFLILLQCLDKCSGCCCPCLPCCENNCYPVTQFTYLDVNNMDIIITQEEIELDQF